MIGPRSRLMLYSSDSQPEVVRWSDKQGIFVFTVLLVVYIGCLISSLMYVGMLNINPKKHYYWYAVEKGWEPLLYRIHRRRKCQQNFCSILRYQRSCVNRNFLLNFLFPYVRNFLFLQSRVLKLHMVHQLYLCGPRFSWKWHSEICLLKCAPFLNNKYKLFPTFKGQIVKVKMF